MGLLNDYEFRDFCYAHFGRAGEVLSTIFPSVADNLESTNKKIHSDVYFSMICFFAALSTIVPFSLLSIYITGQVTGISFHIIKYSFILPASFMLPLWIIIINVIIPMIMSSSRISELRIEIPYASMYISVMASGGLTPLASFLRLRKMDLLPNMQNEVNRIQTIVMSTGQDPVSAMEQASNSVQLKEYNELLLGYASSVRTGGDTLHYLFSQTQSMFRMQAIDVKAKGESAAILMEIYTIVSILGVLGIFLVFVVGMSLPTMGASISPDQFFLFSFVIMPFISFLFILGGDMTQFNYPISNWTPYYIFAGTIPAGLILASQMILPFFSDSFLMIPSLYNFVIWLTRFMNLAEGSEAAVGMVLTLIFIAIPGYISDYLTSGKDNNLVDGVTNFLRDLVEVRKSGLSPEKSIDVLSKRNYGGFSRYLRNISTKINWGYPVKQIYEEFSAEIKNWWVLVNMYLLIETMEVGGGTEQSIESLAEFSETTRQLNEEKKAALLPLIIVPYIGAIILTGTTVMFMSFFTGSNLGVSVPTVTLFKVLLTPLALHSFTLGLVTGKITSGRVSAGFKHGILLCLVSLAGIWIISNMNIGGGLM